MPDSLSCPGAEYRRRQPRDTRLPLDERGAGHAVRAARYLALEEVDDPLERVEAERLRDGRPQVGVRVDVVEDDTAVVGLQVLDPADVQLAGRDDALRPGHGARGYLGIGIELGRRGC